MLSLRPERSNLDPELPGTKRLVGTTRAALDHPGGGNATRGATARGILADNWTPVAGKSAEERVEHGIAELRKELRITPAEQQWDQFAA
jgi:hypothetical protein